MALPQSRTTGEPAKRGNVIHSYCRITTVDKSQETRDRALVDIPDEKIRNTCAGINLELALDGLEVVACERAYVLNVKDRTVRIAGDNIERHYNKALLSKGLEPLGKYDVPATIDVVAMAGGTPVELDYKSGQSIGPVKDNWQRKICATALMIHYGTASAISRVAYVGEDGSIRPEGDEFSCMDIDDFCDEIVTAIDAIEVAKAEFSAGRMPTVYPSDTACKYCNAQTSCPYWTNFAKSMVSELEAVENGPDLKTLSSEQMGKVWQLMKKSQVILKNIEDAGKMMAAASPLVIDDDWEVRPTWQSGRSYFNDSKARGKIATLMAQMGSTQEEIDATLSSMTGKGKDFAKYLTVKRTKDNK
jgi:hypothetical protein